MALIKIQSTNPNLSWILQKNPDTIRAEGKPFVRELRRGRVFGWFSNEENTSFTLWFRDAEVESSFTKNRDMNFEYLDCTRYGSPHVPVAMITTCLDTASKKEDEKDVDGQYTTKIESVIKVSNQRHMEHAKTFFEGATVTSVPLSGKYETLTVEASTVHKALNIFQCICIQQCLTDQDTRIGLDEGNLTKFIRILNNSNAPYILRYLFQVRAINNPHTFKKIVEDLNGPGMDLKFGDTRTQRFEEVKAVLKGEGGVLIDIGCGELFQSFRLAKVYPTIIAIDADPETVEIAQGKVKARKIESIDVMNVEVTPDWVEDNEAMFTGSDVLMTEVLEHIDKESALLLLESILRTDFNRLIVTCPNRDFNVNYEIPEGEFRHSDHQWEPSFEEFSDDMATTAAAYGVDVTYYGIGDRCGDVNTSLMAVFTNTREVKSE